MREDMTRPIMAGAMPGVFMRPSFNLFAEEGITLPFHQIAFVMEKRIMLVHPGKEIRPVTPKCQPLYDQENVSREEEEWVQNSRAVLSSVKIDRARQRYTALVDVLDREGNLNGIHFQAFGGYQMKNAPWSGKNGQ